tara:strand:- start:2438 stop:2941 length:504 start_codon:yes stop_codon:yes gene_type:complete
MTEKLTSGRIFNSTFETGIRSLCALSAGLPKQFDLQQMLAFDHLMVHSADMPNGPPSLHPNVKQRNGELLVRRPLVQDGLALMEAKRLIITRATNGQVLYCATEFAPAFLESLENPYIRSLSKRAKWAVDTFNELGGSLFLEVFNAAFDRWSTEFQIADISMGAPEA